MYKVVLTHEVLPCKFPAMKTWIKEQDEARKKRDPAYVPYRRYITIFGSVHQVVIEMKIETLPEDLWVYAESAGEAQQEFVKLIAPGRTELKLLKELDLGS